MEIKTLTLNEKWDGTGFVVLSQTLGFNFSSKRFEQGILFEDFGFLFDKDFEIDKEVIEQIKKLIERKAKKEDLE